MITDTTIINHGEGRPTIYFLKGLPGSGKSTWAAAMGEILNAVRVNKDELRAMMGLSYSRETEGPVVHASREMGKEALRRGLNVIVDDTNVAQKHLNAWSSIAEDKSIRANLIEVYFDVPVKECIERDKARDCSVGEVVILKMWEQLTGGYCKNNTQDYTKQDEELPEAVIVDLDGTLALTTGRNIYDDTQVHTDVPHAPVKYLVDLLYNKGVAIIFLTGRAGTNSCYTATLEWLDKNINIAYEALIMRPEGDSRKDSVVKKELYNEHVKDVFNVKFVLDDRDSVVDMWRKDLKLPCFQVWYGDF
jgi:predicted kinase